MAAARKKPAAQPTTAATPQKPATTAKRPAPASTSAARKKPTATPTPPAAPASRSARHGADPTAAKQRTATTQRVAEKLQATSTHAGEDATLVARSTVGVTVAPHSAHPGHSAHPRGHDVDQEVTSLADIYTPWANVRANGSGIVALAAWARRLESEGKLAASEAGADIGAFIRGLTHR